MITLTGINKRHAIRPTQDEAVDHHLEVLVRHLPAGSVQSRLPIEMDDLLDRRLKRTVTQKDNLIVAKAARQHRCTHAASPPCVSRKRTI